MKCWSMESIIASRITPFDFLHLTFVNPNLDVLVDQRGPYLKLMRHSAKIREL